MSKTRIYGLYAEGECHIWSPHAELLRVLGEVLHKRSWVVILVREG